MLGGCITMLSVMLYFSLPSNLGQIFSFFQEAHSVSEDANFWSCQWGNPIWLSHGKEHLAGVATLKTDLMEISYL